MKLRAWAFGVLAFSSTTSGAYEVTCESLMSLSLENTTITLAQPVDAGAFQLPGTTPSTAPQNADFKELPPFCRVAATLRPSNDSEIKIEVWMPLSNWNRKFQAVGNGGLAGVMSYTVGRGGMERGLAEALKRGYATASTDTGHTGNTLAPIMGHPEKLVDFGYRAVNEMTVKSKAIIAAFYGSGPRLSYWNGCSEGGRQALMEAQRFPTNYDGIIAGAPANPVTRLWSWNVYVGQATFKDPKNRIPPAKYPSIHLAVMNSCDAIDGVMDGLIENPQRCAFDFKVLECKGEDAPSCLTPAQVDSAKKITSLAVHPKTGETIFPGLVLGSELGWAVKAGGPEPGATSTEYFKYVVFKDPKWDWRTFDLATAASLAHEIGNDILNATDPDLRAFKNRDGKLLMYHGWSDPNWSPLSTINYYQSVVSKIGPATNTTDWLRLFLVPGMGHCGGGEGPNVFDPVSALEQWVENGKAPDQIVASHATDGKVDRTRPLCPYPQVAKYKGSGNIDEAANFVCSLPDK